MPIFFKFSQKFSQASTQVWYATSFEKSLQQRIREKKFPFRDVIFFEFSKCRFLSYIVTKLLALWWERTESINSRCRAENRNILGRKMQKSKCENSSCRRLYLFCAKKKHPRSTKHPPNAFKPSQSQETRLPTGHLVHNAPSSLPDAENRGKSSAP